MAVCHLITENIEDKNPKDNNEWNPHHSAAWNGPMAVCQLIMENIEDKNPKDNNGWTPLHYAASNGHMAVCQLIMENIGTKIPKTTMDGLHLIMLPAMVIWLQYVKECFFHSFIKTAFHRTCIGANRHMVSFFHELFVS